MTRVLIFLHIPKTAGTTLNLLLENYYQPAESYATFPNRMHPDGSLEGFRELSQEKVDQLKLLTGHMGFGLHERFSRPVIYTTLLRDPVGRVVSQYLNAMRNRDSTVYPMIQAGHMDLKEFGRYYAASNMDNLQTRMIAGNWEKKGVGRCDEAMLAKARDNLQRYFPVVGLNERFDEFYLLLCRQMGWRPHFYVRYNQAPRARSAVELDSETRAVIEGYNEFDMALYAFGQSLAAEQVAAQGGSFLRQLRRYQQLNKLYQLYWAGRRVSVRAWVKKKMRNNEL